MRLTSSANILTLESLFDGLEFELLLLAYLGPVHLLDVLGVALFLVLHLLFLFLKSLFFFVHSLLQLHVTFEVDFEFVVLLVFELLLDVQFSVFLYLFVLLLPDLLVLHGMLLQFSLSYRSIEVPYLFKLFFLLF